MLLPLITLVYPLFKLIPPTYDWRMRSRINRWYKDLQAIEERIEARDPPKARRRSRLTLTRAEREDISRGIASGSSIREIARHLDRAASTVGREVTRHGGCPTYRAHEADDHAWESALRPKKCLLALHPRLREVVTRKLILDWSPKQISGWLKPVALCHADRWTQLGVFRSCSVHLVVLNGPPIDGVPHEGRYWQGIARH